MSWARENNPARSWSGQGHAVEKTGGFAWKTASRADLSPSKRSRLRPNGRPVFSRTAFAAAAIHSGARPAHPIIPRPPALETAAARSALVADPIGPSRTGCSIPKSSQARVRSMLKPIDSIASRSMLRAAAIAIALLPGILALGPGKPTPPVQPQLDRKALAARVREETLAAWRAYESQA